MYYKFSDGPDGKQLTNCKNLENENNRANPNPAKVTQYTSACDSEKSTCK